MPDDRDDQHEAAHHMSLLEQEEASYICKCGHEEVFSPGHTEERTCEICHRRGCFTLSENQDE